MGSARFKFYFKNCGLGGRVFQKHGWGDYRVCIFPKGQNVLNLTGFFLNLKIDEKSQLAGIIL